MLYFEAEIYLRVIVSMLVGILIGFERTLYNKPAGIRTFALVSLGSTLITLVSIYGAQKLGYTGISDPLRITAQIVSGIGFLGAGVIWSSKNGGMKHGVTTAAELWVVSAVGMALGVGMYDLAILVVICIFISIFAGRKLDDYVDRIEKQRKGLEKISH
ncbi:putative Mg2+ transporter-C (MgtC) family protein [Desulforamulus putei DSM 12395]|uniref:Putative Mg2+ transporter-C (MgtC) family protein n=1 Tax=Desulforamulus putei DSM 12395 TaxID=1121429 RepID=A0A1M4XJV4_9FIRM|nr:MgtC/SapB family protein [Desulforamulus putei]SHE93690.1 putative Mg2+ transporter-C (MgtC) family protein [Desulforamulus putei DSM 12395]